MSQLFGLLSCRISMIVLDACFSGGFSKDVILPREQTNLWILSDTIAIPPPFPWPVAFSLGDLLIAAGIFTLLVGPAVPSDRASPEAGPP